ncbi:MAG: hypothetical protein MK135_14020, partial [Polyangiaceae bacterium]|nr:hypothetical protein [Polyangiaceae bacterium]
MAGPLGPRLLKEDPAQYQALIRRRIVSASAAQRPFLRCRHLAKQVSEHHRFQRAHDLYAADFYEFGSSQNLGSAARLKDLWPPTEELQELHTQAE